MISVATITDSVLRFLLVVGVGFLAYYVIINGIYLIIHLLAFLRLREELNRPDLETTYDAMSSPFLPGVAILVPAYNEEAVIVETVQSLLDLIYPDTEIIVINDGSTDGTLEKLKESFALEPVGVAPPYDIESEPLREVYRTTDYENLIVVDKENGGKSDALNVGLSLTDKPIFGSIDADSLIDPNGLARVMRPFVERPEKTVAAGGTVQVANGCDIEGSQVKAVGPPHQILGEIQVMEYLRAFYSGRLGLAQIGSLVLISGAFGVFRTDLVRAIGGYNTDTVTEDFDLVVRLHRHLIENGQDYSIDFVPDPVVWTEVPTDLRMLGRQRRRWYRGMVDTLVSHRSIIGSPSYGRPGMIGLPFKLFGEAFGRLMEGMGYVLLPIAFLVGAINARSFAMFFLVTTGFGVFLSWFGIFSEVWGFQRYKDPRHIVRLMGAGVIENLGYRQWKALIAWHGLWEYLNEVETWGDMVRAGFGQDGGHVDQPELDQGRTLPNRSD